jgi:hypothetical protein
MSTPPAHHVRKKTPMEERISDPVTPHVPGELEHQLSNKEMFDLTVPLSTGFLDEHGIAVDNDDYFGYLQSLGFYDPGTQGPLSHDMNTTTAIHFTDTKYKKTPIDVRQDLEPDLSVFAKDFKEANLYNLQDYSDQAAKRTIEKTQRIMADPIRKIQSQILIDIDKEKKKLLDPAIKFHPLYQILAYDQMILRINTLLLDRITDVLDYNEKQYTFSKYELRPLGLQFYCEMTLTADAPTTHFDFTDEIFNTNIPSNAVMFKYPRHNLLSLQIIMDSGTDVFYSTNELNNSTDAYVKLTGAPTDTTIRPGQMVLSSLNIRASGGDAVIRILGLY